MDPLLKRAISFVLIFTLICLALTVCFSSINAEPVPTRAITVEGTVLAQVAEMELPVEDVKVNIKGNSTTVETTSGGHFTVYPDSLPVELEFTHPNFEPHSVIVDDAGNKTIVMLEEVEPPFEVIVYRKGEEVIIPEFEEDNHKTKEELRIDEDTKLTIIYDDDVTPGTTNILLWSHQERSDSNQDGYVPGNSTTEGNIFTYLPDHNLTSKRLQDYRPYHYVEFYPDAEWASGGKVFWRQVTYFFQVDEFDSDGDGSPDRSDAFIDDPTQWDDSDQDGYGDNASGNNPDMFPTEKTQHSDADGDGYGDNESGRDPDHFPQDPSAWQDTDDDGMPDSITGSSTTGLVEDDDDDNDQLPDVWELQYGLDPKDSRDANWDIDYDGHSNYWEWKNSTDPTDISDPPKETSNDGGDGSGDNTAIIVVFVILAILFLLCGCGLILFVLIKPKLEKEEEEEEEPPKGRRGGRTSGQRTSGRSRERTSSRSTGREDRSTRGSSSRSSRGWS